MNEAKRPIRREDFSALDAHHRVGKVFTPPLMRMPAPIQLHSWQNERLPEVLWAVLLSGGMVREEYMPLFCEIAKAAMRFRERPKISLSHTALAVISTDEFDSIFGDLLENDKARLVLAPLRLLEKLPGRSNWIAKLPNIEPHAGWESIARAVAASFDRHSRSAVDAQWLRVMFLGLQHRLVFTKEEQQEIIDMLCAYPEGKEVPAWAVTTIGSIDAAIAGLSEQDQRPGWSEEFWEECLQNTGCIRSRWRPPTEQPEFDYEPAKQRWGQIYAELVKHFFRTLRTTDVDARHDAVFGISLYAMSLVTGLMRPFSTRPSGRHLLRSLVESHITLAYLITKDDPDLWRAYRVHGTGQAKLAFLKLVEQEDKDLPMHVDVEVLERLANEDMWQEFVPIDVGHWADLDARKMAEAAGVKDFYDNYYLWPSGFVHAHWSAVRDSVFDICANPLHRFHRIPRPVRLDMEDVCFDAIEIMNRTLELVSRAYPSFDLRFDNGSPPERTKEPIAKTYQPSEVESRIYAAWEEAGAFRAGRPERAAAEPYCIVIPPPNVTGSLHMGHALNNTLQDILCRFERMRGRDVLWQVGTDHAGIATQAVVERQLMERQQPGSREMGREAFIRRVWEWKAESGGTIIGQLKRLGASCDWSRERFTMDEGLSRAVIKVFVTLYREGLIYKDKRLVNWDPKLKTAISDLEVQQVETRGQLWYIKYPVEGTDEFIVVATTRPETMLGDVAVAVHPQNERLKHLIGKTAILPLVGRRLPVIGDEYADPDKGSGAVKITPAHDFNDFEVGRRHRLPLINVLDEEAHIISAPSDASEGEAERMPAFEQIPRTLRGLDRFVARRQIVAMLEGQSLIEKIEQTTHVVPHGDRSGAVLEPFLTDQWYVDAKTLAEPAIEAVRKGQTVFVPPQWQATFFNWMENIQPWCISRQIWWGHQIPAWYGPDGKIFVAETEDELVEDALAHYTDIEEITVQEGHDIAVDPERRARFASEYLHRDEDVLDTWFSSALWPFSTLGWPDATPEFARYYPTSVLVTGFDIIFFWVARMLMMGLYCTGKVPFPVVYIHALVRDATGAKMSKSKGNVIDPLHLIDEYGADALRFTLAAMAAQGRDIKLSEQRVEGYRNFATKLWNAARFAEMNGCATMEGFGPQRAKETLNRWIAHEIARTAAEITEAIQAYKFNDAAGAAYRFVWNIYCDWYLELVKPVLLGPDSAAKEETRATVAWVRDEILKLLHPFMPFVTEELWKVTASNERGLLALAQWPSLEGIGDAKAEAEIGWVIDLITAVRSLRAEMNVNVPLPLVMVRVGDHVWERAQRWSEFIMRMARISNLTRDPVFPRGAVQLVVRGEVMALPLAGVIDLTAERARLQKEMAKADADIARVDAKLGNPNFVARAPEEVVEEEKEKRDEALARKAKIAEALERLKSSD